MRRLHHQGRSETPVDPTKAAMKAGLLRASDLPAEWKDSGESSASGSDRTQIDVAKTIPSCRGFAQTVERENRQPKSSSNKFVDPTATPVQLMPTPRRRIAR